MKADVQSGVSPFGCLAMTQTDVSGMVHIPQGQEMPPEVKSGTLVAAGDNRSAVGRGSSSRESQILLSHCIYPPGF